MDRRLIIETLFPEYLRDNKDFRVFIYAMSNILADVGDWAELMVFSHDIDKAPSSFLPYLSDMVGLPYDSLVDSEVYREVLKRAFRIYRDRGTLSSIRNRVSLANSKNYLGGDLTLYKGEFAHDEVEFVKPQDSIFIYSQSVWGSDKYIDGKTNQYGILIIEVKYLTNLMVMSLKDVIPAGIKVVFRVGVEDKSSFVLDRGGISTDLDVPQFDFSISESVNSPVSNMDFKISGLLSDGVNYSIDNGIILVDCVQDTLDYSVSDESIEDLSSKEFRCYNISKFIVNSSYEIGRGVFAKCSDLEEGLVIGLNGLGDDLFLNDSSLRRVYSITNDSLGERAFSGCSSVSDIFLSEGLTSLGSESFKDCVNLNDIVIPTSVTSIANKDIFSGCTNLQLINFFSNMSCSSDLLDYATGLNKIRCLMGSSMYNLAVSKGISVDILNGQTKRYIESSGVFSQAINTGLFVNSNLSVELLLDIKRSSTGFLFGGRARYTRDMWEVLYGKGTTGRGFRIDVGSRSYFIRNPKESDDYVTLLIKMDSSGFYINYNKVLDYNFSIERDDIKLYLGTSYSETPHSSVTNNVRFRSAKFYQNNELVLNLIPYFDNTPGMFDTITGQIFKSIDKPFLSD